MARRSFFFTSVALAAAAAEAQTPVLVADINQTATSAADSNPVPLAALGDLRFFTAWDPDHGRELWVTNGTVPGTTMVLDVWPGPGDSGIAEMTSVGSLVVFAASDSVHGEELWVSDGTATNTRMLVDLVPGGLSSFPRLGPSMGGYALFAANSPDGRELFRTDGTEPGTFLIADLYPGPISSAPDGFVRSGSDTFFMAFVQGLSDFQILKSDGTGPGTVHFAGPWATDWFIPQQLVPVSGDLVFFTLRKGAQERREVWRTDGTPDGTFLTKDIRPGDFGSNPRFMTAHGPLLLFAATDSSSTADQLWVSDGSMSGTRKILVPGVGVRCRDILSVGTSAIFGGFSSAAGWEPWSTDGTDANTAMLADIRPGSGSSNAGPFAPVGSGVVFPAFETTHGSELWFSDLTPGGTSLLADIKVPGESEPSHIASAGDGSVAVFAAHDHLAGREPHAVDLDSPVPVLLADINPIVQTQSSFPEGFLPFLGGAVFFACHDFSGVAPEPCGVYITLGTPQTTVRLTSTRSWSKGGPQLLGREIDGRLVFVAAQAGTGGELWSTDGTPENTLRLTDLCPGSCSAYPTGFVEYNGLLYTIVSDGVQSILYRTDGTIAGTQPVSAPPIGDSIDDDNQPRLAVAAGLLFFVGADADGSELWAFNGTSSFKIQDIKPGPDSSFPGYLRSLGDRIVFTADDGLRGTELWVSDGVPGSAVLHSDLVPGPDSSDPMSLAVGPAPGGGQRVFFRAEPGIFVAGPLPGSAVLLSSESVDLFPTPQLTTVGTRAFFTQSTAGFGDELWVTDGTPGGTRIVKDLAPGEADAYPGRLTPCGNRVYFSAVSDGFFTSVFVSDGTEAGTVPAINADDAEQSSSYHNLACIGPWLYVSLSYPALGNEPHRVPICLADFNLDGQRTILDIFACIEAWFINDGRADFDPVPGRGIGDIFAFLELWFIGCP